jgi:hypothetical protein
MRSPEEMMAEIDRQWERHERLGRLLVAASVFSILVTVAVFLNGWIV